MPYPETTAAQARKLVKSFTPFQVYVGGQGFVLSAKVVRSAVDHKAAKQVNGKWTWVEVPGYEVVFEGGKWGSTVFSCATSSLKRIAAHWDGYKAAHVQASERALAERVADRAAPPRPVPAKGWKPQVGDKVWFGRGMFGKWPGTIRSLYQARGPRLGGRSGPQKGAWLAEISFKGRNGRGYVYTRVEVATLTSNGHRPVQEAV